NMEKEILEAIQAIAESLKPVVAFVNESAAAKADETQTKVDAEALDSARAEGAKSAAESFKLIDDAELPAKITEGLKAKVLEGKDVTDAIADAKAVAEAVIENAVEDASAGYVIESAGAGNGKSKADFSLNLNHGGRR